MFNFTKSKKVLLTLILAGGVFILFSFSVLAAEINETKDFYIDPIYDWKDREEISASLMRISNNAYFYIEDEYWNSLSNSQQTLYLNYLDDVASNFDNKTYPLVRNLFGSEWKPGIDNNNHIIILLSRLKNSAGGYFNPKDEYSIVEQSKSNEREMIYINATQIANSLIDSFIAHEFQHLINWNQKDRINNITEEVWLNELRSEYAPTVAGYDSSYSNTNLERRMSDFLANPFDSLTEWTGSRYDYPSVNLFGHYLAEQFGQDILYKMITNNKVGIYSIEQAIKDNGYNLNFSQVFNNWTIANYLNNKLLLDGRYGYKDSFLENTIQVSPINYSIVSTSIINIAQNIKDWAPYYYRFFNKQDSGTLTKDLEIEFKGSIDSGNFNVIYIIDYFSKSDVINSLTLQGQKGILKIPNFRDDVDSITLIISNQFKKSNFSNNEISTPFILSLATTIFQEPTPDPEPEYPTTPQDHNLTEGDLIRAEGDFDIFIINQYGYKRLFLNPTIFEMYGHLGSWKDVKTVTPETRDAFITSTHYRYVNEDKVYHLNITGEDTGTLHWLNMTSNQFLDQGGIPNAVFTINKDEYDWYGKGEEMGGL